MSDTKSLKMFRNPSDVRILYLRPRPGQKGEFRLEPKMTITAQDEAEQEQLMGMLGLVIDVEAEAPAVASVLDDLRQKLIDEKSANEALRAENKDLKERTASVDRITTNTKKK